MNTNSFQQFKPLYAHNLFNSAAETFPIEPDLYWIRTSPSGAFKVSTECDPNRHMRVRLMENKALLTVLENSPPVYVNGTTSMGRYLYEGDWLTVNHQHYIISHKRDFGEATIQMNSRNEKWANQLKRLPFFAASNNTTLILAESGCGKEVLAQLIHALSPRRDEKIISVNCSALNASLIESELFGHKKGAYTGATADRKGAFEAARGGTLFLDEIGDLPLDLQPKLLRAIENNVIQPVGSDRTIQTDVRIVAATHTCLADKVQRGLFRKDLYYRLNVLNLTPPPLKQRPEDFEALLYHFCKQNKVSFSFHAINALKKRAWEGNVRELKNMVLRAKALFIDQQIHESHLQDIVDIETPSWPAAPRREQNLEDVDAFSININQLDKSLGGVQKKLIIETLKKNLGNQRRSAMELGIPKSTLHDRIKAYQIDPKVFKAEILN